MQRGKNLNISFFRFVTVHAFDRQTDGRTELSSLDRYSIPCSAVKSYSTHKLKQEKRNVNVGKMYVISVCFYRAAWNADMV